MIEKKCYAVSQSFGGGSALSEMKVSSITNENMTNLLGELTDGFGFVILEGPTKTKYGTLTAKLQSRNGDELSIEVGIKEVEWEYNGLHGEEPSKGNVPGMLLKTL